MAMMDYGVIAKKDGHLVTTDFFTPMMDTLGTVFEQTPDGDEINGHYFVYLGEPDFYIGIYKGMLGIFSQNERLAHLSELESSPFLPYKTYRYRTTIRGVQLDIKRLDEGHRYYLRFWYNHHCYEAIYGYGIDQNLSLCYGKNPKFMRRMTQFLSSALKK